MCRQTRMKAAGSLPPHQNQAPFISWKGRQRTTTPASWSSLSPAARVSSTAIQRGASRCRVEQGAEVHALVAEAAAPGLAGLYRWAEMVTRPPSRA